MAVVEGILGQRVTWEGFTSREGGMSALCDCEEWGGVTRNSSRGGGGGLDGAGGPVRRGNLGRPERAVPWAVVTSAVDGWSGTCAALSWTVLLFRTVYLCALRLGLLWNYSQVIWPQLLFFRAVISTSRTPRWHLKSLSVRATDWDITECVMKLFWSEMNTMFLETVMRESHNW